jgi:hypothetical protein
MSHARYPTKKKKSFDVFIYDAHLTKNEKLSMFFGCFFFYEDLILLAACAEEKVISIYS